MHPEDLPDAFVAQLNLLLGEEAAAALITAITQTAAPLSIRYHPKKKGQPLPEYAPVPWSDHGFYLDERKSFTLDPLFHAGVYYVQEAASMLIGWILQQLPGAAQSPRILDLCGAPGGKSTLIQSVVSDQSLLVANEVIRNRYPILRENLVKWGYPNKLLTNADATAFEAYSGFFDVVLVDAPCSGEGLFRKDPQAVGEWSLHNQQLCAGRQKRILSSAVASVRPGGWLLYSTCTYNPDENEANVRWLQEDFGFEPVPLALPESWGVLSMGAGYQCFPHLVRGEGFYMACLQKTGGQPYHAPKKNVGKSYWKPLAGKNMDSLKSWLHNPDQLDVFSNEQGQLRAWPSIHTNDILDLMRGFPGAEPGVAIGQLLRQEFIPAHDLIVSTLLSLNIPLYNLDTTSALRCLKKENIEVPHAPKGWIVAAFENTPIALLKNIGSRINNYYPKEWRIRMNID